MHRPGIEPGSSTWKASILPVNHRHGGHEYHRGQHGGHDFRHGHHGQLHCHYKLAARFRFVQMRNHREIGWFEKEKEKACFRDVLSAGVIIPICSHKESLFSKTLEDMTRCLEKHPESDNSKLSPEERNTVLQLSKQAVFEASCKPTEIIHTS
ncbi:hypothetical protein KIN20_016780 [Parelaphostrongylus tenuis]|uniref:Uncharacterized protein n=1 Tax=Parelaphostrongylus tenuis TaxID=148309 RepID=A0AAD5N5Q2_PARTN|nr:hypothetical protein KIN20_016780 [Parelaphostrongylus tenuis]